jgi:hypothetical protein
MRFSATLMRPALTAASAVALAFAAGCDAEHVGDVQQMPREQITFAATARYPGNAQSSDKVQAVALDAPGDHQFTIYNLSDRPIPQATVWVDGSFVRQLDGIGPKSHLTLNYADLIQAGPSTTDLKQSNQAVSQVELQTADGLFKVEGPGMK